MSIFFNHNNNLYPEGTPVLSPDNSSFRYGDGVFETMKAQNCSVLLKDLHIQRLFSAIKQLDFELPGYFTPSYLEEKIAALCKKNQHTKTARVRLTVYRGDGIAPGSLDNYAGFIIQSWEIYDERRLNPEGLVIDIYPHARKSCDSFSNLKSNNFLSYILAANHAKKNNLDDCLLLNSYERMCESSIANLFIIKDNTIYTPPLSEGCVAGVVRRWILENSASFPFPVIESPITIQQVADADEIFLTNAIRIISWVRQFRISGYKNQITQLIYNRFIETIS